MQLRTLACVVTMLVLALGAARASAATGPALSVDAGAGQHEISPYIYGWNYAPADVAAAIDLPVDRQGGNAADTLNWQTGTHSTSSDWFFENVPWCWSSCNAGDELTPYRAYTDQIDADRQAGAKSLVDVPMLGYVAADVSPYAQPLPCSFTKAAFATQNLFDTDFDPNCGDGHPPGDTSSWVTNAQQLSTAVADSPANEGAWVDDLVSRYNDAANGGVAFYELGNEPGLWDYTHHDWHPQPTTATELRDDMLALAAQIKQHDPTAQVIGPAEWGWPNYFCSAADEGCGPGGPAAPDANSDWTKVQGGTQLMPWLLQQFKQYADAHGGTRLLDYLDVHYYRQTGADGIDGTRSLWDPNYTDPSWINDVVQMIPRMRQWVDDNYPGTKISLSEYDLAYGTANEDVLTEADTLGIFGREGLDLATLWPETDLDHYVDAFKLFRNYDGNHSQFGDTAVSAQSGDQSQLAVYAAKRTADGALTLIVINKSPSDLTSMLSLTGFTPGPWAHVWRFSDLAGGIQLQADQSITPGGFSATYPAMSASVVVVPPAAASGTTGPTDDGSTTPPPSSGTPQPGGGGSTAPPPRCKVPKLSGLTLKKAKAKLRKAHCRLGKVKKKNSAKRKGRVIAQTPKAGKRGKAGMKVALVLSRGR